MILQGTTLSEQTSMEAVPIEVNLGLSHTGTGIYVYDLDCEFAENEMQERVAPFLMSADIGRLINYVHANDIDYTMTTDCIAGKIDG